MRLSELFSSSSKTAVLETLAQHRGELHLRRIAELSHESLTAVNAALKTLCKERIVNSKKRRQKVFFSIDWQRQESLVIKAVIEAKDRSLISLTNQTFEKRLLKSLSFTDELHKMRTRTSTKYTALSVFEKVKHILSCHKAAIIITKELASNLYRAELRAVHTLDINAIIRCRPRYQEP